MYVISQWSVLARRELEGGRLGDADVARLEIISAVIEDWKMLGGGGLALP